MSPSILLTGPTDNLDDWSKAAREAGFEVSTWPLVTVEPVDIDLVQRIDGLPDWLCITSRNALHAIEEACQHLPELRSVPAAVVGPRTAAAVEAMGLKVELQCDKGARALAEAMLEAIEEPRAGTKVLWPRGSLSDELAHLLREGGTKVDDPVVYTTKAIAHDEAPPTSDVVFFASPSAVRAWPAAETRTRAVAIGASTRSALENLKVQPFEQVDSLEDPRPASLTGLLGA